MRFTYEWYKNLLKQIKEYGYQVADYKSWREKDRPVILRHDVDYDIEKAVKLSAIERIFGVASTYFVLLTSDFYNVFSKKGSDGLKQIATDGHTIALHFDEVCYPELFGDVEAVREKIIEEAELLSKAVGNKVDIVSMHRPSKFVLEADLNIPGMINSYGQTYFKEFKYLSDSRRRWREPVDEIIRSEEYERLHILTHPFWYNEKEEDIHSSVSKFINTGDDYRYQAMEENITDLTSVMSKDEIAGKEAAT